MADLQETPSGNRLRIAFFGLRNAGKSTLVNEFCAQKVAIVSDTPGTTTDPVTKAMELFPLGPCLITDTAGLDDKAGELGAQRVKRSLEVLSRTDIAVWVSADEMQSPEHDKFIGECNRLGVKVIEYRRGQSVEELRQKIAVLGGEVEVVPSLLEGIVHVGDRVVCVCPVDAGAPKGRLILPQVQVIRACLDMHIACSVVQVSQLASELQVLDSAKGVHCLVVTDSQAFGEVHSLLKSRLAQRDGKYALTSFSILFARQKGELATFLAGVKAIASLNDGDTVLIAEGCTHHRQCGDIGSVKIPKALKKLSGKNLKIVLKSGNDFLAANDGAEESPALVVHCGGCMLTRREVLRRILFAKARGIPIANYGMVLAAAAGVDLEVVCAI